MEIFSPMSSLVRMGWGWRKGELLRGVVLVRHGTTQGPLARTSYLKQGQLEYSISRFLHVSASADEDWGPECGRTCWYDLRERSANRKLHLGSTPGRSDQVTEDLGERAQTHSMPNDSIGEQSIPGAKCLTSRVLPPTHMPSKNFAPFATSR